MPIFLAEDSNIYATGNNLNDITPHANKEIGNVYA